VLAEGEKYNTQLFKMLGSYTDKDPSVVLSDTNRDLWLSASEALEYGN
jgi:ATP-dependent protease ClpP protease subunit